MTNDKDKVVDKVKAFEEALKGDKKEKYVLILYVSGTTQKAKRAIRNISRICEEDLKGRCDLEIIDIRQHPDVAITEDILPTPTLVRKLPPPLRKLIGDLSDRDHVLVGLDIVPKS